MYKVMFVSESGREYMMDLQSNGAFGEELPFVAWEVKDGFIEVRDGDVTRLFSSLDEFAIMHGCMIVGSESIEPTN